MAIETALVVDDSRSARYILQRLLERQHIHVDGVDSAEEALAYLCEVRPDVVFMDEMLPGMDGQEAIERLSANPITAGIPIVMYTARDYASDTPSPQRRGVVGVLSKPFTPQDVDALLAQLGGVVAPRPVAARLVRKSTHMPMHPASVPVSANEVGQPLMSDVFSRHVVAMVATEMNELRTHLTELVKVESKLVVEQVIGDLLEDQVRTQIEHHETGWRRALDGVRHEQNKFQEQVLERRVPRLLEILDLRMQRRMDALQKTLNERIENSGLGPIQRSQITQIVRTTATDAVQRPARQVARHAAAELIRTDINALSVRLDRLRRRFSTVATSAVAAVLAAVIVGYFFGRMG